MSWFSKKEGYSTKDSGFYAETEITYGSKKSVSGSSSGSPSGSSPFDDYQNVREMITSTYNNGRSR